MGSFPEGDQSVLRRLLMPTKHATNQTPYTPMWKGETVCWHSWEVETVAQPQFNGECALRWQGSPPRGELTQAGRGVSIRGSQSFHYRRGVTLFTATLSSRTFTLRTGRVISGFTESKFYIEYTCLHKLGDGGGVVNLVYKK